MKVLQFLSLEKDIQNDSSKTFSWTKRVHETTAASQHKRRINRAARSLTFFFFLHANIKKKVLEKSNLNNRNWQHIFMSLQKTLYQPAPFLLSQYL